MTEFTAVEWAALLPRLHAAALLARLACEARERGRLDRLPAVVCRQMTAAEAVAAQHARSIRWEVDRVRQALAGLDVPVILLKGAAYLLADLPPARGRLVSDVDIMVPRERLDGVEAALNRAGWAPLKSDAYDDRYYRRWMHELPPLQHTTRGTILDVHHGILPRTARFKPEPALLWADARPLAADGLLVLAPRDMALHVAAHLFGDGEVAGAVRDLMDLADLLRVFGEDPGFASALAARAAELDLERPLFYGLRYAHVLLDLDSSAFVGAGSPPTARTLAIMDGLVGRALLPAKPDGRSVLDVWALRARAHYLRMPWWLLAPHLARKTLRRLPLRRRRSSD